VSFDVILLILGIASGSYAVYLITRVVLGDNSDASSLAWATGDSPTLSKSPVVNFSRPLIHNFTLAHAKKIKSPSYRKKIEQNLKTSGIAKELNVDEFIGMQILWGFMFPLFLFFINFALELGISLPMILGLGLLGFAFPNLYASDQKKKRNLSIQTDLPFFIDLLALTTEAGKDLIGALQRIVEKAPDSVLAQEFEEVLLETRVGVSRADALRNLADRVDLSEIMGLVAVIVDADAAGVSVHKVLKDQAEQMRLERFVRAEKAGARASQSMMIPMVLFIVPAVFLTVLGPVILSFMGLG
jgi:tight adherence protein C